MAQIRLGDFGNKIAPAQRGAQVASSAFVSADPTVPAALQNQAEGMVAREQAQQQAAAKAAADKDLHEAEQRHKDLLRAQQLESYVGYQADVNDLTDGLTKQLSSNQIARDAVPEALQKGLADIKKKRTDGLDPTAQATLSPHLMQTDLTAGVNIRKAVDLSVKNERIASINTTGEELQRLAVKDPAKAIRQWNQIMDAEGPGILGADKVAGQKQAFSERAWSSHFTQRMTAARNDVRALSGLETDIAKNDTLDPDKKNILVGRVQGMREVLASRADRAERSRLATIDRQINSLNSITMQGYDVPAEQLMAVQTAAKGTVLEPMVRQMVVFSNESAKFRALPPRAQEAYLNDLEGKVRTSPTPETVQFLDKLQVISRNQAAAVKSDPISFAAQKGLADVQPLDFSKPDTLKDQMLARLSVSEGLRSQYGAPLKVFTQQETKLLSESLKNATAADKSRLLGMLHEAIPDARAYQATMQQIAPDSPVTAFAGQLMGRGDVTVSHLFSADTKIAAADVAARVLRGENLLNPPSSTKAEDGKSHGFQIGKETDFTQFFNNAAGKAFPGAESQRIRDTYYQATKALYADMSLDAGDRSGQVDGSRVKKAFEAVTGGGVVRFGDSAVIPPFGMSGDALRGRVYKQFSAAAEAGKTSVPATYIKNASLYQIGDGRFLVEMGGRFLPDEKAQGKGPLVLDVTDSNS